MAFACIRLGLFWLLSIMGACGWAADPAALPPTGVGAGTVQAPGSAGADRGGAAAQTVVLIELDGLLGPSAADRVRRGLDLARREKAQLAVLQLDSAGGLDASVRDIVQEVLSASVPVAALVGPGRAQLAGAGIWVMYACAVAAMSPNAVLGRPTPAPAGLPNLAPAARPAAAGMPESQAGGPTGTPSAAQELALLRGRNPEWPGQAMLDDAQLGADDAVQRRVVNLQARDVSQLLLALNGRQLNAPEGLLRLSTLRTRMIVFDGDWKTRLLSWVADPLWARMLLLVGICGLLMELSRPGLLLPGAIGAASLTLAVFGLRLLDVHPTALGLIVIGVLLVIAQGMGRGLHGLGLAGAAALATGATALVDDPTGGAGAPGWLLATMSAVAAVVILAATRAAAGVLQRTRPAAAPAPTMVGSTGQIVDFMDGEGWAQIHGDYWPVTGLGDLSAGAQVRVSAVEGPVLRVSRLDAARALQEP